MSRREIVPPLILAAAFTLPLASSAARSGEAAVPSFGQPVTTSQLANQYAVPPAGTGLPSGRGTVDEGRDVYVQRCASCHGANLEGSKGIGAPALVGGRSTLASAKPMKTVESYWPYATTLFDYIRRAMPLDAPGSLTPKQVYGVTAYILAQGHVIDQNASMDANSLPKVRMPNANGFIADPR